jgi:hypothetical protein
MSYSPYKTFSSLRFPVLLSIVVWHINCGRNGGKRGLVKWSSVFNLTSVTLLIETVFCHLIDYPFLVSVYIKNCFMVSICTLFLIKYIILTSRFLK